MFLKDNEVSVVSGSTDNHLMILDLSKTNMNGMDLQNKLDSVNITTNKEIAKLILLVIHGGLDSPTTTAKIKNAVKELTSKHPIRD